jgi:hypothetical protein
MPYAPWCWYIQVQNWVIFRANVGIYSSTMEHMGIVSLGSIYQLTSGAYIVGNSPESQNHRRKMGTYNWRYRESNIAIGNHLKKGKSSINGGL